MPRLDLKAAKRIRSARGEVQALRGPGFSWKRPGAFPALAGDFVHFRQEDVTAAGVTAKHGLPLSMSLVGTLARARVGAADYMDCTTGALDVVRTPWPAETGFALWAIVSGARPDAANFYNGAELNGNTLSNLSMRPSGKLMVGGSSYVVTWAMPAATGPETICWHRPNGAAVQASAWTFRRNGVALATPTGTSRATYSNGAAFTVGGTRTSGGAVTFGGMQWRDFVLVIGRDLTAQEIADLEAYAAKRIAGTA